MSEAADDAPFDSGGRRWYCIGFFAGSGGSCVSVTTAARIARRGEGL
jgi:hypothetical protein